MHADLTRDTILKQKIITIVRGDIVGHIEAIAEVLIEEDITVIEVTMNSPNALQMIERLSRLFGDRMHVGAGTVLTQDHLHQVYDTGAKFIVAPDTYEPVIRDALSLKMLPIPGAYTASEIRHALRLGAELIKLFPATPAGPDYVRQLGVPLDSVKLIPTGGVSVDNIPAFLRAGAVAFGIGRSLIDPSFDGSFEARSDLRRRAQALKAALSR